jgi:hypothetical protein
MMEHMMINTLLQEVATFQGVEAPDGSYGCRYQTEEDAACQQQLEAENSEAYRARTGACTTLYHNL